MAENEANEVKQTKKMNPKMIAIICVAVVAVIAIVAVVVVNVIPKGVRGETITAENYEEVLEKVGEELKDDDDLYYFSYSVMTHIFSDGLSAMFSSDETAIYKSIFGKTVQQIIDEGKQLASDAGISVDQLKQQLESMGDIY